MGAGQPYSPVRGPSGLPKRGLVAPGAGTKVPRRLRLGPAVNWEWRGRPSSREWLPWSSLWLRVWGWDPNCGPAGRYWDRPSWPSWLAPHLPEFSREFRPLHVGPCGAAPLGCGSPRCCRARQVQTMMTQRKSRYSRHFPSSRKLLGVSQPRIIRAASGDHRVGVGGAGEPGRAESPIVCWICLTITVSNLQPKVNNKI